ncbi:MltA-interacting protein MipA [Izhakiella australiensis]|uniref:MltA-interacting protein MipA n=1 Tax=Izhakiella australiensis TaxID=1926881 RepID=A0A1S8YN63_9GAMM|nr:MipA/OmpV family protein [Izhakiella australiensis]OON40599.1 MltA-interacting protein MipA [Izhakiella australiensis]
MSTLTLGLAASLTAVTVAANPLTLGASVFYSESPYKSGQNRYYPVPVIDYEGDNFYFHSLAGGYYLWKDEQDRLSLMLTGSPQQYDPDDADSGDMKALDKRRMTLMGGVAYRHTASWGIVRTTLLGDVLNNSNGIQWDLAYLYRFQLGDFGLTPGIGAVWSSKNQNRYYYGISSHESARSGLSTYNPDDSWNPYLEMTADYRINDSWRATLSARYTHLDSEITDSPMVDKHSQTNLWTGISYTF